MQSLLTSVFFFFFNDTATTEIYTLSLHDALPISPARSRPSCCRAPAPPPRPGQAGPLRSCSCAGWSGRSRSEEHTSELQSQSNLVCRLLLEKKKKHTETAYYRHICARLRVCEVS